MGSMPSQFDVRMVEKAGPIVGNLFGYLAGISANGGRLCMLIRQYIAK